MILADVALERVRAGDNDRTTFDESELRDLAESIERDGLAQPPTLRPVEGGYEIVAGERRIRALRLLGHTHTPAFIRDLDDRATANVMLAENNVRVDLDPIEEAKAYRKRVDAGDTTAEVAKIAARTERHVKARIDLLSLTDAAQHLIATKALSASLAAHMVGLDADRQTLALRALAEGSLTQGAFKAVCGRLHREQEAQPLFDPSSFWSVEEYVTQAKAESRTTPMVQLLEITRALIGACLDPALADRARALLDAEFGGGAAKMPYRLVLDNGRSIPFRTKTAAETEGSRRASNGETATWRVEQVA